MSGKSNLHIPTSKSGLSPSYSNIKSMTTSKSISNADLLSSMNIVKSEILLANKAIADRHDNQIH